MPGANCYLPRLEILESRVLLAVLYVNGPYITGVGNGYAGSNTSVIETGFETFGYLANSSFHSADDFNVPAGIGWNVAQIKVLAYQTNGPVNGGNFSKIE